MIATMTTMSPFQQPGNVMRPVSQAAQLASLKTSDAPWLYSALTQLREIEQNGAIIPGVGDLRIGTATATKARLLLAMIDALTLPTPNVAPVSGGGMSIEWTLGPKEVKYAFYPDGETIFYQVVNDEVESDGNLQTMDPNEVTGPLKWMLGVHP
ncbi:MAG: hypothetical protein WBD46_17765 [Acidobacteriaceae bacterium]